MRTAGESQKPSPRVIARGGLLAFARVRYSSATGYGWLWCLPYTNAGRGDYREGSGNRCHVGGNLLRDIVRLRRSRHPREPQQDDASRAHALAHDEITKVVIFCQHNRAECQRQRENLFIRLSLCDLLAKEDRMSITREPFRDAP